MYQTIKREINRILSNKIYLMAMVLIPLLSSVVLLSIMDDGLPQKLPVAIVDMENSSISHTLIRQLGAMSQTEVKTVVSSFDEAHKQMKDGHVYAIIVIPKNFLSDLVSSKIPTLKYYTNNTYLMAGGLLFRDLKLMTELATGKAILESGLAHGKNENEIMASIQPIKINSEIIGNPWLNYSMYLNNNLLPGILQLIILQITVFSISIEIKEETVDEWLALSNGNILKSAISKLMVHFVIFFIVGLLIQLLLYGYECFTLMNGWGPMIFGMIFFIIASQSLGILFVTLLPSPRLSLSLASLFGMLSFSMGAFSYPSTAMYGSIRMLTNIFPLRHYNEIYIEQALSGYPISLSISSYIRLMLFLTVAIISLPVLKKEITKIKYIK